MCTELDDLGQAIVALAGRFDARVLTPAQAGAVVEKCNRIESSVSAMKALAAARHAEGRDWKADGYRSSADHLAARTGMSPASAKRALEAGARMAEQPEVAEEALAGRLSPERVAAVADGVAADPTKANELIEAAKSASMTELSEKVSRIKTETSGPDRMRRERHAKRSFRRWTDREGAMQAHLYGHPEDGARLWQMLDPVRRRLWSLRRQEGSSPKFDSLDYDALMTLVGVITGSGGDTELTLTDLLDLGRFPGFEDAAGGAGVASPAPEFGQADLFGDGAKSAAPSPDSGEVPAPAPPSRSGPKKLAGSPIRIMVRVDLDTLLRGYPVDGEVCEIPGYGPVSVDAIKDLLATESPFIVGILSRSQEVVGVFHYGRHPNAAQRSALDFMYPTCAVEGCGVTSYLQYDHRVDWAKTKFTVFDLLDRLCSHHHRLKTTSGWALVEGRGKRAFVPPDDPRHPGHGDPPPTGPRE